MAGMSAVVDQAWPLPRLTDEPARLAALHQLEALDQPRRADLDVLVRLAAYVCGTPTAVINLIDRDRQWPAAAYGYEPGQVSRADSMCATSIQAVDVSYTPNAARDARWPANPHVTGELGDIRLYAAAPLTLAGGEIVGTVCAFSNQTDELSRLQLERLRDVAEQAVRMLELRKASDQLGYAATRDALTGLPIGPCSRRRCGSAWPSSAAAAPSRPCCFSTWTGSRRSTTPTATRSATTCCARCQIDCWPPFGRPICGPAGR